MKKCKCCRYTKRVEEFGKVYREICFQCLQNIRCNPHWCDDKWLKENVYGPNGKIKV